MKSKKRILSIGKKLKKQKNKENEISIEDIIEEKAPGLYEFYKAVYSKAVDKAIEIVPDIVWIFDDGSFDSHLLIKQILHIQPKAAIFVMIIGAYENEQEIGDSFMALGIYKCYFLPPLLLDSLVHDMYVALNME